MLDDNDRIAHIAELFKRVYQLDIVSLLERMRLILSSAGALWHLWGKAPRWWGLVRVRSRTVHTSWLPDPAWRGHPSRIFTEQADDGETVVKPTFESRLVHTEESAGVLPDGSCAVYVKLALASAPLREAIAALNCPVVDLGMGRVGASAAVFVNAFFFSTIALRDECVIELNVGFAARADGRGQRPTVN